MENDKVFGAAPQLFAFKSYTFAYVCREFTLIHTAELRTQVQRIIRIKCKLNFVFLERCETYIVRYIHTSVGNNKISKAPPIFCDFLQHLLLLL